MNTFRMFADNLPSLLLTVTWQLAGLAVMAWICEKVFRLRQARARYALWWFVLVAPLLLAPVRLALSQTPAVVKVPVALSMPLPAALPASAVPMPQPAISPSPAAAGNWESPVAAPRPAKQGPWRPDLRAIDILCWLWLLGGAGFTLRLLVGYRQVRKMLAASRPVQAGGMQELFAALCAEAGLRNPAELRISDTIGAPAICGILQPKILLPAAWLETTAAEELRALLAHEVAHIKRRDPVTNFLQRLIEIPLFFHPAAWWASRKITLVREELCDGWVLHRGADAAGYARFLVAAAENASVKSAGMVVGLAEGRSTLLHRVEAIMNPHNRKRLSLILAAVLVGIMLICATAFAAVELCKKELQPTEKAPIVVPVPQKKAPPRMIYMDEPALKTTIERFTCQAPYDHNLEFSLHRYESGKEMLPESTDTASLTGMDSSKYTTLMTVYEKETEIAINFAAYAHGAAALFFDKRLMGDAERRESPKVSFGLLNGVSLVPGKKVPIFACALDRDSNKAFSAQESVDSIISKHDGVILILAELKPIEKIDHPAHVPITPLAAIVLPASAPATEAEAEEMIRVIEPLKRDYLPDYLTNIVKLVRLTVQANEPRISLALLKGFRDYPLCREASDTRLEIAREFRAENQPDTAVKLLRETMKTDPFGISGLGSIALLADILDDDLGRAEEARSVRIWLATNFSSGIPLVGQVIEKLGKNAPIIPRNKLILLDESLGESAVYDRMVSGASCNFGQNEVLMTLLDHGFVVHHNEFYDSRYSHGFTPELLSRYGLVIMNGLYAGNHVSPSLKTQAEMLGDYVKDGGSLLVISASNIVGNGTEPEFYNQIIGQFGLRISDSERLPYANMGGKVTAHPAVKGLKGFHWIHGVPILPGNGEILGYAGKQPVIALIHFGRGTVIVAGIGTGLMGQCLNTKDSPNPHKAELMAEANKALLLRLVNYLLSPTSSLAPAETVAAPGTVFDTIDLSNTDAEQIAAYFKEAPKGSFAGGAGQSAPFKSLLPPGVTIISPGEHGSRQLVVSGTPEGIARTRELVRIFDQQAKKVRLEVSYYAGAPEKASPKNWATLKLSGPKDLRAEIGSVAGGPQSGIREESLKASLRSIEALNNVPVRTILSPSGWPQMLLTFVPRINGDSSMTFSLKLGLLDPKEKPEAAAARAEAKPILTTIINVKSNEECALTLARPQGKLTIIIKAESQNPK